MAIAQASLSSKLKAEIQAVYGMPEGTYGTDKLQKFCDAVAKAIVDEIHQNLTMNVVANDISIAPTGLTAGVNTVTGTDGNISGTIPAGRFL